MEELRPDIYHFRYNDYYRKATTDNKLRIQVLQNNHLKKIVRDSVQEFLSNDTKVNQTVDAHLKTVLDQLVNKDQYLKLAEEKIAERFEKRIWRLELFSGLTILAALGFGAIISNL